MESLKVGDKQATCAKMKDQRALLVTGLDPYFSGKAQVINTWHQVDSYPEHAMVLAENGQLILLDNGTSSKGLNNMNTSKQADKSEHTTNRQKRSIIWQVQTDVTKTPPVQLD